MVPSGADGAIRSKPLSTKDILARSTEFFASKGIETARLDAERMVAEVIGVDRLELYLEPDRIIKEPERDRLRELVRRRGKREPAQHILGAAGFYGLEIAVDGRALIPRRETEQLVDRAKEIAGSRDVKALDLGTGSGCIALALAGALSEGSQIVASDVSGDALALAAENAGRLELAERVKFVESDMFAALEADGGAFDIIVANLPYIKSGDIDGLMPEVRDHEPHLALDGGSDGLDAIRVCVQRAPELLAPDGWLLMEVGLGQAEAVAELMRDGGFAEVSVLRDASDIDRFVQGKKAT